MSDDQTTKESPPGSAWLPITTAPKDGTKILGYKWKESQRGLYHDYPAGPDIRIVYWQEYSRERMVPAGDNLYRKEEEKYFSGWLSSGAGVFGVPHDESPSHWMPLPDPPNWGLTGGIY